MHAQAIDIEMTSDKNEIYIDEYFDVKITISGQYASIPDFPHLPDFTMINQSVYNQTEAINFKFTQKTIYTYTLSANKEGEFTIGPVKVFSNGQEYLTKALKITVKSGGTGQYRTGSRSMPTKIIPMPTPSYTFTPSAPRRPYYNRFNFSDTPIDVEANLKKETYYLGEQIILAIDIISNYGSKPEYQIRITNSRDLLTEQITPSQNLTTDKNGVPFSIQRTYFLLYAIKPGKLTINSFPIIYLSLLGRATTETPELNLQVQPLPPPPSDMASEFSKGIGEFTIHTSLQNKRMEEGKPFIYKIEVSGKGNASLITLKIPEIDGLEKFDVSEKIEKNLVDEDIVETKKYEITYIPRKTGDIEIPAISSVFFNPSTGEYYRAESGNNNIVVTKSSNTSPSSVAVPAKTYDKDTKYTSPEKYSIKNTFNSVLPLPVYKNPLIIIPAILPSLLFLIIIGKAKKQKNKIPAQKTPLKDFKNTIKNIKDENGYAMIAKAMNDFLSKKLGNSDGSLTSRQLVKKLEENGFTKENAVKITEIFNRCDKERFASAHICSPDKEFIQTCIKEAEKIDKEIKKERKS